MQLLPNPVFYRIPRLSFAAPVQRLLWQISLKGRDRCHTHP